MKIKFFKILSLTTVPLFSLTALASQQEGEEVKKTFQSSHKRTREDIFSELPKSKKIKSADKSLNTLSTDHQSALFKKMFNPKERMNREDGKKARILIKLYQQRYPTASKEEICDVTGIKRHSICHFIESSFDIDDKNIAEIEKYIDLHPIIVKPDLSIVSSDIDANCKT